MTRPGPGLVDTQAVASDLVVSGRTAAIIDQISPGSVSVRIPGGAEEELAAAAEALRGYGWQVDEPGGWLLVTRGEEPFSAGRWHPAGAPPARRSGRGAAAGAVVALGGAGFFMWAAWTGYNPLWLRLTGLAAAVAVVAWLRSRRHRAAGRGQARFWPLAVSFPDDYEADPHLAGTSQEFSYASPQERREAAARWQQGGCVTVNGRPFTAVTMEVL
jgi:hypothetical protein